MNTRELWDLGKKYVPDFIGVFPLDKIPTKIVKYPSNFIANTHTANLPGEHWLAVHCTSQGVVHAFDPFGIYYPKRLRDILTRMSHPHPVLYNTHRYQNVLEDTCGYYCIAWLICINIDG